MEPSAQGAASTVAFGNGYWKVVESSGMLAVRTGMVLRVYRSDPNWFFLDAREVPVGNLDVAKTTVMAMVDGVLLESQSQKVTMRLVAASRPETARPWGGREPPRSLTRVYKGSPEGAAQQMRMEAALLEPDGYVAISQQYAKGQWGMGAWIVAFLLMLFLVGFIVLFYMVAVSPDGTLTVVYERHVQTPAESAQPAAMAAGAATEGIVAPPTLRDRLAQLEEAKAVGLLTDDEYAQMRAKIIEGAV